MRRTGPVSMVMQHQPRIDKSEVSAALWTTGWMTYRFFAVHYIDRLFLLQERRSSLKQASQAGYSVCSPVVSASSAAMSDVELCITRSSNGLSSNRLSASGAACYNSIVTPLLRPGDRTQSKHTSVSNSQRMLSRADDASGCGDFASAGRVRSNADDKHADDESVSTADICNCSPSFDGRRPLLQSSRRQVLVCESPRLADNTRTTTYRRCENAALAVQLAPRTPDTTRTTRTAVSSQLWRTPVASAACSQAMPNENKFEMWCSDWWRSRSFGRSEMCHREAY